MIDKEKFFWGCTAPESRAVMASWAMGFRRAKRAGFFRVLGTLLEVKCLKTLGKSTFRRAKRAGFLGVSGPPFEAKT